MRSADELRRHQAALRVAKDRAIVTPEEYALLFAEGQEGYRGAGLNAADPYMIIGECTAYERARMAAWENGWWYECRKEARGPTISGF